MERVVARHSGCRGAGLVHAGGARPAGRSRRRRPRGAGARIRPARRSRQPRRRFAGRCGQQASR
eukprot:11169592-Lingulodinium_polyedra.AAC.1